MSWTARRRERGGRRDGIISGKWICQAGNKYLNQPIVRAGDLPVVIPRPEHNVSRADISKNALKVLYRLKEGGYQAFLVGGGVRDLLLGLHPKDFDVATDAHPEDLRRLFRNCRLIGRRFRLAHVYFGREVIEVATFRGAQEEVGQEPAENVLTDDTGRIIRDNSYGAIEEDVWRRDFTANALYYNIKDFSIWDYTGGVHDVRARVLRLIGDAETRYREDPVRMLRAVRFAAKLDFSIHRDSERPLEELAPLLRDVPAARLLDEALKLFLTGHAQKSFELLREHGLFGYLFPFSDRTLDDPESGNFRRLVERAMKNTDERVAEGKPVTPTFLFAVFLWEPVRQLALDFQEDGMSEIQALQMAADEVVLNQQEYISIPRRVSGPARDILSMQPRFRRTNAKRARRLLDHPRFRAAYDFLLLRAEAGEEKTKLAEWWTKIQEPGSGGQGEVKPLRTRPRRRRRSDNKRRP